MSPGEVRTIAFDQPLSAKGASIMFPVPVARVGMSKSQYFPGIMSDEEPGIANHAKISELDEKDTSGAPLYKLELTAEIAELEETAPLGTITTLPIDHQP